MTEQRWYTTNEILSLLKVKTSWSNFLKSDIKNEYQFEKCVATEKNGFFTVPSKWEQVSKQEYENEMKRNLFCNSNYRKSCKNKSWKEFIKNIPNCTYFLGYKEIKFGHTNNSKNAKILYSEEVLKAIISKGVIA